MVVAWIAHLSTFEESLWRLDFLLRSLLVLTLGIVLPVGRVAKP